ncbi:MAG TPA: heat-inducible transcription repressor HrcA [Clostridiales bacterium]|nr:heat-inducible transcription repressor HrcA [Clostridiales bacterium]
MPLDERKKNLLKAIIDDYIDTAEPVGSKALVNKFHFNFSPATVRNEMAELEELGFLEQPHTSAGRIPSDKGYRAYVDSLLQIEEISAEEAGKIRHYMQDSLDELTGLIRKAANVLSDKTGYTSLALSPQLHHSHLQQIKILMIEPGRALVVVVLSAGVVKDRLVRIPDILDANQLMQIASAIEEGLSGMTLDNITLVAVTAAAQNTRLPESLLNQVLFEAYVAIKQADNLELYLDGSHKLLSYPEFQDIRKAKDYLNALSRDGIIAGYMSELKDPETETDSADLSDPNAGPDTPETAGAASSASRIEAAGQKGQPSFMVRIGQEIMLEGLNDCSFVTTTYKMGERIIGRIGVIGPRRMTYGRVISNISFVKQTLNEQIRRIACGDDRMEGFEK